MRSARFVRFAFLAALVLAAGGQAFAQAPNNPVGLWTVQGWVDNAAAMPPAGVQNICFLANGTWFSPTFAGWNGLWFQKGNNAAGNGDRVRIIGNYANNVGNDGAEVDFTNLRLMVGTWSEWRDGFPFVFWGRVTLTRIGNCVAPPAGAIQPQSSSIDPLDTTSASIPPCQ
jgi:hypothetical protein